MTEIDEEKMRVFLMFRWILKYKLSHASNYAVYSNFNPKILSRILYLSLVSGGLGAKAKLVL